MRKLVTLFKEFINAPIQIYSGATFKKGLYDLLDVYDNTVSGDLVIVKGNHNVGDNSIQLKDGVNWKFLGNPTISSDSSNFTFKDSASTVDVYFDGDVNIVNTASFFKRISLASTSKVHGYKLELVLQVDLEDGWNDVITKRDTLGIMDYLSTASFNGLSASFDLTFTSAIKDINSRFTTLSLGGTYSRIKALVLDSTENVIAETSVATDTIKTYFTDFDTGNQHAAVVDAFSYVVFIEQYFD